MREGGGPPQPGSRLGVLGAAWKGQDCRSGTTPLQEPQSPQEPRGPSREAGPAQDETWEHVPQREVRPASRGFWPRGHHAQVLPLTETHKTGVKLKMLKGKSEGA